MRSCKRGFTLPELMVACTLISMVSVALLGIFHQATGSTNLSSTRMSLSQRTINAFRRIQPFLVSAFGSAPGGLDSVQYPSVGTSKVNTVVFSSTEDFLDPSYPENTPAGNVTSSIHWESTGAYTPASHPLFFYRFSFVPPPNVVANQMQPGPDYGSVVLERASGDARTNDFSSPSARRLIVRGEQESVLESFHFSRPTANVIQINARMRGVSRGPDGQIRGLIASLSGPSEAAKFPGAVVFDLQTSLNIAAESLR